MTRAWPRGIAFLVLLAVAFAALVHAYDLADPPPWRGLAILFVAPCVFRLLNRFEPPRVTASRGRTTT